MDLVIMALLAFAISKISGKLSGTGSVGSEAKFYWPREANYR